MGFIISLLLIFLTGNFKNEIQTYLQSANRSTNDLIGTWKSIPSTLSLSPTFEIIINNDSIFISRNEVGAWGYRQLLSYEFENDTIIATEIELIGFDQNLGHIYCHYKYRQKIVKLVLTRDNDVLTLNMSPREQGGVLVKESNLSSINYNFDEQFEKRKVGHEFRCDYKKNGKPITKVNSD